MRGMATRRARRDARARRCDGATDDDWYRDDVYRSIAQGAKTSSATTSAGDGDGVRTFTDEERKWFYDAMASGLVNEVERMKEVTEALRAVDATATLDDDELARREALLEDLTMRVENVDNAGDLYTIGGFEPLIATLKSPHESLRAGAAEALATTTQNHEKVRSRSRVDGVCVVCCVHAICFVFRVLY